MPTIPTRDWAATSLGELCDRWALPALYVALRSRRPANDAVIRALTGIGDPAAVDVLLETLGDHEPCRGGLRLPNGAAILLASWSAAAATPLLSDAERFGG